MDIIDYEKNFVLVYEDLIKIESKINKKYEEFKTLLFKEMKIIEDEYNKEEEIFKKRKTGESNNVIDFITKISPFQNYEDQVLALLKADWNSIVLDDNSGRPTIFYTKWLKEQHSIQIIKLLETDGEFWQFLINCNLCINIVENIFEKSV
uniref:ANK_REP_REGION domain-containing protein n=1 Tax=Meloidogyne hapla TaxID=6305 RepID=A0A1I8BFZ6_MELHA